MYEAVSTAMDAVAIVPLISLADVLVSEYKADGVTLADPLTSDLTFFSLLFVVNAEVIRTGHVSLVSLSHISHLLLAVSPLIFLLRLAQQPLSQKQDIYRT